MISILAVHHDTQDLVLTIADKEHILAREKLDDRHINLAEGMLKQQFSEVAGLKSILLQAKKHPAEDQKQQIQIVHSRGDHWIVASAVFATGDEVLVYDSVYRTIDQITTRIISKFFPTSTSAQLVEINRQSGGQDGGVFAIAITMALALHQDKRLMKFNQRSMRPHLVTCLEKRQFSLFQVFSNILFACKYCTVSMLPLLNN